MRAHYRTYPYLKEIDGKQVLHCSCGKKVSRIEYSVGKCFKCQNHFWYDEIRISELAAVDDEVVKK